MTAPGHVLEEAERLRAGGMFFGTTVQHQARDLLIREAVMPLIAGYREGRFTKPEAAAALVEAMAALDATAANVAWACRVPVAAVETVCRSVLGR